MSIEDQRPGSIAPRGGAQLRDHGDSPRLFSAPTWPGGARPAPPRPTRDVTYHSAATLTGPSQWVTSSSPSPPTRSTSPPTATRSRSTSPRGPPWRSRRTPCRATASGPITPTTTAAYKTRILVRRPINPAHFNGTVIVEWMNVSAGESAPDWDFLNPMLMRDGYAYVGVSAQALGVDGGKSLLGTPSAAAAGSSGLVGEEPARYGTLHHPGDQYALDMYAQIGQALRAPHAAALGGLKPKHILAIGESQSAFYLTTFADALQPLTNVFDGIFIHSRGGSGASLAGTSIASSSGPDNLHIRTDLKVPVFMSETQTDLIQLGYAPAQQPNTDKIRTWEIAGTSHADAVLRRHGGEHPRLHHAREQRTPAQRRPGGLHRLRQVGGRRHAAPEPAAVQAVEHRLRRRWPSMRTATSSGESGHRRSTCRSPPSAVRRPPAPAPSARSSARPSPSRRPSSPASTGRRATTSPSTRRAWTRRSPRGTSSAPTRPRCWPRRSRCSSPAT